MSERRRLKADYEFEAGDYKEPTGWTVNQRWAEFVPGGQERAIENARD